MLFYSIPLLIIMIKDNIREIKADIAEICATTGRNADDVILVGVTKYSTVDEIKEGINAGLTHIAENYVQDARDKLEQLEGCLDGVTRHMIGHLQSNKAKTAVGLFDMIQSVDSVKLAREIDKQAAKVGKVMDLLIEVNSGEEQKSGLEREAVADVIEEAGKLEHIRVLGLMTMAPFVDDEEIVRAAFRNLRELRDELAVKFSGRERTEMKYLSMGMSADYKIALEEGANMLRIGTRIFKD